MTWFREHPRAVLLIAAAAALPFTGVLAYRIMGMERWSFWTSVAVVLPPYVILAVVNGWVLRIKSRSLHWLWLYLVWNWYGALIPVVIALLSKQPVNQQV